MGTVVMHLLAPFFPPPKQVELSGVKQPANGYLVNFGPA